MNSLVEKFMKENYTGFSVKHRDGTIIYEREEEVSVPILTKKCFRCLVLFNELIVMMTSMDNKKYDIKNVDTGILNDCREDSRFSAIIEDNGKICLLLNFRIISSLLAFNKKLGIYKTKLEEDLSLLMMVYIAARNAIITYFSTINGIYPEDVVASSLDKKFMSNYGLIYSKRKILQTSRHGIKHSYSKAKNSHAV